MDAVTVSEAHAQVVVGVLAHCVFRCLCFFGTRAITPRAFPVVLGIKGALGGLNLPSVCLELSRNVPHQIIPTGSRVNGQPQKQF